MPPTRTLTHGTHRRDLVPQGPKRVTRSVVRSVGASLLLVRWDGHDEALTTAWSLFKLKERCAEEVAQEAVTCTERRWQRTLKQLKQVASCSHNAPSLLSTLREAHKPSCWLPSECSVMRAPPSHQGMYHSGVQRR